MSILLLALVVAGATTGDASSSTVAVGDATPVFSRAEPNLAAGQRALDHGDIDMALERFRRAVTVTDDERAVVEYDVGQALTLRAMAAAKEATSATTTKTSAPDQGAEAPKGPAPPDVDDALATFERAATLARDQRLASEARLGAGNAALVGGKIDDAVSLLRKALVADPHNDRARRNLQRALTMQQQSKPPPSEGGDDDKDKKDQDNKDQDKKDQDKDKKDGDQQKPGGDKDKQDKQDAQGKPGDEPSPDGEDQQDNGEQPDQQNNEPKPDNADKPSEPTPGKQDKPGEDKAQGKGEPLKAKPTTKEEAQRQLKGIRSRERPLSPFEMRGTERQAPSAGKDW
jgi:Ca-activated chloride channel family protein